MNTPSEPDGSSDGRAQFWAGVALVFVIGEVWAGVLPLSGLVTIVTAEAVRAVGVVLVASRNRAGQRRRRGEDGDDSEPTDGPTG